MDTRKIAVIVGSIRRDAFSRKVAKELIALAPQSLSLEIVEIGGLSLYNQDLDDARPPEWLAFHAKIKAADGLLFVTPEHNRSIPAALKNALDIGSRPYGKSAWNGKPGAVVSVSPGAMGGFGANHQLRQTLMFLNVPLLQQPEAYIGSVMGLLNESGKLTNDATRDFFKAFMEAYAVWVEKITRT